MRHRGATHWLSTWLLLALFTTVVWDVQRLLFWFAMGNVEHWFCDAVTISGAPVGWWSDRRITLFGGRVKNGGLSEAVVTCALVALCAAAIYARRDVAGSFIPFFYHWGKCMNVESSTNRNGGRTGSTSSDALTPDVIRDLLQDRSTSYWLARSHADLLARDPVDALNDAHFLYQAMQVRWDAMQV